MPFINDVLEENQRVIEEQKAQASLKPVTRFLFDPESIASELKSLMVGQDDVIDQLANLLLRVKAELIEANKPLLVVMLLGPTGVGKTQLVNHLARLILGSEKSLCRIDMNTLSQSHYSAALTGAPPGYAGSKENHTLFNTDAIAGSYSRPGIVLFDEIEKASQEVCRSLLNVLDNAQLTLSSGSKIIDFSNSLIFMTSNIGSEALLNRSGVFKSLIDKVKAGWASTSTNEKQAFKALQNHFDPEFINRIEEILYFNPLTDAHVNVLIELERARLHKRIKQQGYTFSFSKACIAELKIAYQHEYGARNITHRIRKDIEPKIAEVLLDQTRGPREYVVDWDGNFYVEQRS